MNRPNRHDVELQALIEELTAVEAFQAQRSHLAGRSLHVADDMVLAAADQDIRWLLATDRSLRECIAEDFSHRQLTLN